MATTFQVFYLGRLADISTTEGNSKPENVSGLIGLQFGDSTTPLYNSLVNWSAPGAKASMFQMDGTQVTDEFSINGGPPQTFDSQAIYKATLTYSDGRTANISAMVTQDTDGNTYGAPTYIADAGQTALKAGTIVTLSLDSLLEGTQNDLISHRMDTTMVTCPTRDTQIRTAQGDIPIELLRIGDLVMTYDRGLQPIQWIGSSRVTAKDGLAPIRFDTDTIGNDRPLLLSPQHRVMIPDARLDLYNRTAEVLLSAGQMINNTTIVRQTTDQLTYTYLMFDQPELIWSNGALIESFYPGPLGLQALPPGSRTEILTLFPDIATEIANLAYGDLARPVLSPKEWRALR